MMVPWRTEARPMRPLALASFAATPIMSEIERYAEVTRTPRFGSD
jgi:hypothetical protein